MVSAGEFVLTIFLGMLLALGIVAFFWFIFELLIRSDGNRR